jgi:hypothetical protein
MGSIEALFLAGGEDFLLNVITILGGLDNLLGNFIGSVAGG